MRKPWWKRAAYGVFGAVVSFLIVNISQSVGWNVLLRLLGVVLFSALVLDPYFAAVVLYMLRLRKSAARYAGWACRHFPLSYERPRCALLATNLYLSFGDTAQSLEYVEIGMALSEKRLDNPRMRTVYAYCLNAKGTDALNRGKFRDALDAFSVPIRMRIEDPLFNALFYSNSSTALYCLGRFPEALSLTEHARILATGSSPTNQETRAVTHHNAALTLIELGRAAEALTETQTALELKMGPQTQAMLWATHALTLWLNEDAEGAESAFQKSESLLPVNEPVCSRMLYGMRGKMRAAQNLLSAARADLLLACEGYEVSPASYYQLAHLADRCGNPAEAAEWRARLLHEVPESFYAQRIGDETAGMV